MILGKDTKLHMRNKRKIIMKEASLERLPIFGYELCCLMSQGRKETIQAVEEHINQGDLVEYIYNHHKDYMAISFDYNCPYNLKLWDEAYSNFDGYVQGNEKRKFGILNEDDGLLLITSLTFDILGQRNRKTF